jgi:hypothetical protein
MIDVIWIEAYRNELASAFYNDIPNNPRVI